MEYPEVVDIIKVGAYDNIAFAGAGFFYDEVLEYRVWCYPSQGAKDVFEGDDYFYPFENFNQAFTFANQEKGRQEPIALIKQYEWINEIEEGKYIHERGARIAEWNALDLKGRKRQKESIVNKLKELTRSQPPTA
ncbi:MAG: hypothetical protein JKY54_00345 [Flavobacteriales bacterium]|nr:hypothetical protein [Flavobacteriales bacterium]